MNQRDQFQLEMLKVANELSDRMNRLYDKQSDIIDCLLVLKEKAEAQVWMLDEQKMKETFERLWDEKEAEGKRRTVRIAE